jgi:hypothetical protein
MNKAFKHNELCSGIFWVITDSRGLDNYRLLTFTLPCDECGNLTGTHELQPNSKNGKTYNHKLTWEAVIKNDSVHKPYNRNLYDCYPRGRVEVANRRATIFLNPHINIPGIVEEIAREFGLNGTDIANVRVVSDGSTHYRCFIDKEE